MVKGVHEYSLLFVGKSQKCPSFFGSRSLHRIWPTLMDFPTAGWNLIVETTTSTTALKKHEFIMNQ